MTVTVLRLCCFESTTATAPVDLVGEKIDAALRKALGGMSQSSVMPQTGATLRCVYIHVHK